MEQLSRTARFWQWWAALSLRRPWLIVLLGILAFVASIPGAARLYRDLRTDLRELLPQGAPAAVALAELEKRIGGSSYLAYVVRTHDVYATTWCLVCPAGCVAAFAQLISTRYVV